MEASMLGRILAVTPEHHYAIVNGRPVIFHPTTRRIIHVY
jgi:hypothetical protein